MLGCYFHFGKEPAMPIVTNNLSQIIPHGYVRARGEHGWGVEPALDDSSIGAIVLIASKGWGISSHDCHLFGRIVKVNRTRFKVELLGHHPFVEGRNVLSVNPACLQLWVPEDEIATAE